MSYTPRAMSAAALAREEEANRRRESALAALFPNVTTWAAARREAAALGFTVRPDTFGPTADGGRGYEVFPKGDGRAARYVTTPADALFSVRVMAADMAANRIGFGGPTVAAVADVLARAAVAVRFGEEVAAAARVDVSPVPGTRSVRVAVEIVTPTANGPRVLSASFHESWGDYPLAVAAADLADTLADNARRANAQEVADATGRPVIVSGNVGPDWRPHNGDSCYAQEVRPDGESGPFAFGPTEADARAVLLRDGDADTADGRERVADQGAAASAYLAAMTEAKGEAGAAEEAGRKAADALARVQSLARKASDALADLSRLASQS